MMCVLGDVCLFAFDDDVRLNEKIVVVADSSHSQSAFPERVAMGVSEGLFLRLRTRVCVGGVRWLRVVCVM